MYTFHRNYKWWVLLHHPNCDVATLKFRRNIWYLIQAFILYYFDVGLLMDVWYPKRSSSQYFNFPLDLINGVK